MQKVKKDISQTNWYMYLDSGCLCFFPLFYHVVSDHTKVQYFVNVPNVSSYSKSDLEILRDTIATLLGANYDDVIVSGVKKGCVIVIFMIRNYLIPHLRTLYKAKEGIVFQEMLEYKIFKVMIRGEVLYKKVLFLIVYWQNDFFRILISFVGD